MKERSGEAVQNILIVGVGGQGVLLASEVLAVAALQSGFEAKKSEVHGMAQRGGVVSSHVRFGRSVLSPLIKRGDADVILAFEEAEALRWSSFLRQEGILIVNRQCISSPLVTLGLERYPENIASAHSSLGDRYIGVDAFPLAMEMGDPRLVNTIMLGALSQQLPIPLASWERTLRKKLPERLRDLNQLAFEKGRQLMAEARGKGFRRPRAARPSSARMVQKEGRFPVPGEESEARFPRGCPWNKQARGENRRKATIKRCQIGPDLGKRDSTVRKIGLTKVLP